MENLCCSNDLFLFFLRVNYPNIYDIFKINPFETSKEINLRFSKYLKNKCSEEQLKNFLPESHANVLLYFLNKHPLYINGFHPAFIIHFNNFLIVERKNILTEYVNENQN